MSGLQSMVHLSAQTWLAIGAVVVLVGLLLAVRVSRARNIVVASATVEMMVYQLSRIADALDRGNLGLPVPASRAFAPREEPVRPARVREEAPPATRDTRPGQRVNMSMFGR